MAAIIENGEFNTFINNAIAHGKAISEGDFKRANKINNKLRSFYHKVERSGKLNLFAPFLAHENENVRLYAASFYLQFDPEVAVEVLKDLATLPTVTASYAEIMIDLYNRG